jgi:hypothetical protein
MLIRILLVVWHGRRMIIAYARDLSSLGQWKKQDGWEQEGFGDGGYANWEEEVCLCLGPAEANLLMAMSVNIAHKAGGGGGYIENGCLLKAVKIENGYQLKASQLFIQR